MISVVVPTYNRSGSLHRIVDALEAQVDAPGFELIVVDNASTDDTWTVLEDLAARAKIELRPLHLDVNRGPAAARNAGWRAARHEFVLLTDDDCVPQSGWLSTMAKELAEADMVQGMTKPNPGQSEHLSWFSHTIDVTYERGFYETCNMGFRKDLLERLGGFDEGFARQAGTPGPAPFGDDVDLGWRAKEAGVRFAFSSESLVWHDVRPGSLRSRLASLPRQESLVLAVRRHPGLRAHLTYKWFYQPSHPRALALLLGLLLIVVRPFSLPSLVFGALLAVPWFRHRTEHIARKDWARLLPSLLVFDVAETASFARGSIRHRSLLL